MHGRRRLASALFRTVLPLGVSTHSDTQRPLSRSRHGAGFRPSRRRHATVTPTVTRNMLQSNDFEDL